MTARLLAAGAFAAAAACGAPGGGEAASVRAGTGAPVPKPERSGAAEQLEQTEQTRQTPAPQGGFAEWKREFRARALSRGISARTFDAALAGAVPDARVLKLDRSQPEFTMPIWEYLDVAVSPARIAAGRRQAERHAALLRDIEARFGVDGNVLVAIWGLETAYGANMGSFSVIRSMATLAHDGRRGEFAEDQLIAALQILQAGDVSPDRMTGSWAGAMGHTQFIPTSYADYAVDHTGDGRRDVWAENPADALASAANYLHRFGWTRGEPAVVEIELPEGFDHALAGQRIRKTVAEWRALGVAAGDLPEVEASVVLPAGAGGPAFLALPNFRVVKRYNNATSYALAVAHLAARIGGGAPFAAAWPRGDRMLGRGEKVELQRRLTALGHDTGGIDGIVGPNSRAAVRAFQRARGVVPDGYVSGRLLELVRKASGAVTK